MARAGVWIVLALCFLVWDASKIRVAHAAGKPVTVWMALQAALWVGLLVFWSFAGWRAWKSKGSGGLSNERA